MDWLIQYFYYEGDLLKSCLALFGFMVLLIVILEGFHIIKSGVRSLS
jgi:hypothetical protein